MCNIVGGIVYFRLLFIVNIYFKFRGSRYGIVYLEGNNVVSSLFISVCVIFVFYINYGVSCLYMKCVCNLIYYFKFEIIWFNWYIFIIKLSGFRVSICIWC